MKAPLRFLPGARNAAHAKSRTLAQALLGLLVLLLASACGPGVGGTGTGNEPQLARFGATAAAVCSSALLSQLACAPTTTAPVDTSTTPGMAGTASLPLDPGTAAVRFADAAQRVLALLQGNRVELNAPCAGLRFGGDWGLVFGQTPRFYGWAESSVYTGPAVLEASISGNGLVLRLLDENGRVLLGPVSLGRSTALQAAGCN